MIVFDLLCAAHNHVFEAWFGSSGDFADQKARGLLLCPICGDGEISKAVMAPNVAAKANARQEIVPMVQPAPQSAAEAKTMLAAVARAQSALLEKSTWVGRKFADQARAMEAGEMPHASIYGEVTPPEAKALIEDGIGVMPLPLPIIPPDKRN